MSKPSRARARAMAAPIPLLPPVIKAISLRAMTGTLNLPSASLRQAVGYHAFRFHAAFSDPCPIRERRPGRERSPPARPRGLHDRGTPGVFLKDFSVAWSGFAP